MVTSRRAASTMGCLFAMLVVVAVVYFGVNVGVPYLRYYQFRDAMEQETRFAERKSDAEILRTLRLKADSLSLPLEAQRIHIRRTPVQITIWTKYTVTIEFPFIERDIAFQPVAERGF
jgi:hypothetical protein